MKNNFNIIIVITLILFFSCKSIENFRINKVQEFNPNFPKQKYEFPLLTSKSSMISRKINSDIVKDFLDIDIENKSESIFENVWATKKNSIPRLSDLTYQINMLNDRIYSVTLNAEGCGAYCEYFSYSYNYDLSNGNKILLDSIFSQKGKAEMLNYLSNKKRKIIESYVLELKKEEIQEEDKEEYNSRFELYEDCLKDLPFASLEYFDFKINNKQIILTSDRCSVHVNRAIDDLDEYEFKLDKNEVNNLLSNYGRIILKTTANNGYK
ncbi:hypothetical protein [Flagellimonas sp.]|jgi:hypothetical protein|uniref:hypothetical protein n=1 Tax=Flagellimonas sp. TaxID=2058762 RepID=UPI003BA95CCC